MKLKNKIIVTTGLGLSVILASCSTTDIDDLRQGYTITDTSHTYPAVALDYVKVIFKDQPNASQVMPCTKYDTISMIEVEPYNAASIAKSPATIKDAFQRAGASIGADAVVNIVNSQGFGSNAEGYAIKCKG